MRSLSINSIFSLSSLVTKTFLEERLPNGSKFLEPKLLTRERLFVTHILIPLIQPNASER
jgi:hypothetical protein